MKKSLGILLGIILSVAVIKADNKIYTTDVKKLPENSQQFLTTHFKDIRVAQISIEKNWLGVKDYDVILADGTEIEFTKTGEWKDVKRTNQPVPEAIIIAPINSHVKDNFPDLYIKSIERDNRKHEVKLNNGLELEFDLQGRFIRIDN